MKKEMKLKVLLLSMLFLIAGFSYGQSALGMKQLKKEKLKAKKIAFISNKLHLTPEEAEKFWPVYNEENAKIENAFRQIRKQFLPKEDDLSNNVALEKANKILDLEAEIITHKRNMVKRLDGIISGNKILELLKAEKEFRRIMMKEMRKKKMKQNMRK